LNSFFIINNGVLATFTAVSATTVPYVPIAPSANFAANFALLYSFSRSFTTPSRTLSVQFILI
jgi:hypothetical protein